MEEDLLKRRMLSNYCTWFLKIDIMESICLMRLQKEKRKREPKMKIKIINRNYSIECNCDFDSLTIKEIDDLEKIIKELHTKFSEVKLQKEREKKNEN